MIIDEYYGIDARNGREFDESTEFYLASCTKSFMSALIGIAIDEGLISGVDAKLTQYFPALADSDDGREEITLEHLLTHTSGIEWGEWNGGAMFHALHQAENWVDFVLDQPHQLPDVADSSRSRSSIHRGSACSQPSQSPLSA